MKRFRNQPQKKTNESINHTENTESHIYDNVQIKDVMNGSNTKKLGEYSFVIMDSTEVTDDVLTDWYFNFVAQNDFNWSLIIYSDKERESGVYAIDGMILKNVEIKQDFAGDYVLGDMSDSVTYVPTEDNKLEILQ